MTPRLIELPLSIVESDFVLEADPERTELIRALREIMIASRTTGRIGVACWTVTTSDHDLALGRGPLRVVSAIAESAGMDVLDVREVRSSEASFELNDALVYGLELITTLMVPFPVMSSDDAFTCFDLFAGLVPWTARFAIGARKESARSELVLIAIGGGLVAALLVVD